MSELGEGGREGVSGGREGVSEWSAFLQSSSIIGAEQLSSRALEVGVECVCGCVSERVSD